MEMSKIYGRGPIKSVWFDEKLHKYFDEFGNEIESVTTMMKRIGASANYEGIPEHVLNQAAERGTKYHRFFETAIDTDGREDSMEPMVMEFIRDIYPKFTNWMSETILWIDREAIGMALAGKVDIICYNKKEDCWYIIELKATSRIYRDPVARQLSLYRMMFSYQNMIPKDRIKLACIHLDWKNDKIKWVDINPLSQSEIDRMIACGITGETYTSAELISDNRQRELAEYLNKVAALKQEQEEIDKTISSIKEELYKAMLKSGTNSIETDMIKFALVAEKNEIKFNDGKFMAAFEKKNSEILEKFRTDNPEIVAACNEPKHTNGYLKVTLKRPKAENQKRLA